MLSGARRMRRGECSTGCGGPSWILLIEPDNIAVARTLATFKTMADLKEYWPALNFPEWKGTCATLHMWTQVVGKIRLALSPWTNHSWHVTLYVTTRGLTTSPIPHGLRIFEIAFDFIDHKLEITTSDGGRREIKL